MIRYNDPTKTTYDRTYEKQFTNNVIRQIQSSVGPTDARILLKQILSKYGDHWFGGKLAPDIKTWLKYLIKHDYAINYYRKRYRGLDGV